MQIKEIAELLQIIEQSAIEEFELERAGVRIRIRKKTSLDSAPPSSEARAGAATVSVAETPSQPEKAKSSEALFTFNAPIVGTFYGAPKPDAEPFVKVGDRVSKGTVLCIIEAMKIFNHIESDVEGEIVRVLVENGQPVEYGEGLFEIRLNS